MNSRWVLVINSLRFLLALSVSLSLASAGFTKRERDDCRLLRNFHLLHSDDQFLLRIFSDEKSIRYITTLSYFWDEDTVAVSSSSHPLVQKRYSVASMERPYTNHALIK